MLVGTLLLLNPASARTAGGDWGVHVPWDMGILPGYGDQKPGYGDQKPGILSMQELGKHADEYTTAPATRWGIHNTTLINPHEQWKITSHGQGNRATYSFTPQGLQATWAEGYGATNLSP